MLPIEEKREFVNSLINDHNLEDICNVCNLSGLRSKKREVKSELQLPFVFGIISERISQIFWTCNSLSHHDYCWWEFLFNYSLVSLSRYLIHTTIIMSINSINLCLHRNNHCLRCFWCLSNWIIVIRENTTLNYLSLERNYDYYGTLIFLNKSIDDFLILLLHAQYTGYRMHLKEGTFISNE